MSTIDRKKDFLTKQKRKKRKIGGLDRFRAQNFNETNNFDKERNNSAKKQPHFPKAMLNPNLSGVSPQFHLPEIICPLLGVL